MKVETLSHRIGHGWSVPAFPDLDSDKTLVLVFGGAKEISGTAPLESLASAYPRAHLLGCSTAGEILGQAIFDDSLVVAVCRFDSTPLRSTSQGIEATAESFSVGVRIGQRLSAPDLRGAQAAALAAAASSRSRSSFGASFAVLKAASCAEA